MVGWRNDPVHQQLTKEVEGALDDKDMLGKVLQKQAALRRPMPLREYVDSALAVYIAPHDYSYRDLTLAVAQQLGSSHEDRSVDESIAQMHHIRIGGHLSYVAPLLEFTNLIIGVGKQFLVFACTNSDYSLRFFRGLM